MEPVLKIKAKKIEAIEVKNLKYRQ